MEFLSDNNIIFPSNSTTTETALSSSDLSSRTITNSSGISSIHDSDNISTNSTGSLNFNSTLPSFCLKSIISQEQIHEAREQINEDMNTGKEMYLSNQEKIQRVFLPDNVNKYSTILSKQL